MKVAPWRRVTIISRLMCRMQALAGEHAPEEIVGMLGGVVSPDQSVRITAIAGLDNIEPTGRETSFRADPADFYQVYSDWRKEGIVHLGFYHSHFGPAFPSAQDTALAWPGTITLILGADGPRCWWPLPEGDWRELPLEITKDIAAEESIPQAANSPLAES